MENCKGDVEAPLDGKLGQVNVREKGKDEEERMINAPSAANRECFLHNNHGEICLDAEMTDKRLKELLRAIGDASQKEDIEIDDNNIVDDVDADDDSCLLPGDSDSLSAPLDVQQATTKTTITKGQAPEIITIVAQSPETIRLLREQRRNSRRAKKRAKERLSNENNKQIICDDDEDDDDGGVIKQLPRPMPRFKHLLVLDLDGTLVHRYVIHNPFTPSLSLSLFSLSLLFSLRC